MAEVLVVDCRRAAQSSYVAEVEGMRSLRRIPRGSGIGRRHRRCRLMRRASSVYLGSATLGGGAVVAVQKRGLKRRDRAFLDNCPCT